jgi:hypothetical protein
MGALGSQEGPSALPRGPEQFVWKAEKEPHSTRRRAILAKHGEEVRALYGHDWTTGAQVRPRDWALMDWLERAFCEEVDI